MYEVEVIEKATGNHIIYIGTDEKDCIKGTDYEANPGNYIFWNWIDNRESEDRLWSAISY